MAPVICREGRSLETPGPHSLESTVGSIGGAEDEILVDAPTDQEMVKEAPDELAVPKKMVREAKNTSPAAADRAWVVEDIEPPEGKGNVQLDTC